MGYRIEGYAQLDELQGGNKIRKVREYHVFATPSETYFQFRRPKVGASWVVPTSGLTQISDRIEAVLALPNVVDVQYSQDVKPSGQLVDWMTTYYQTDDGAISGSVESSMAQFGPGYTGAQVSAEVAAGGDVIG